MMKQLMLHPTTRRLIDDQLAAPSHAVLLVGEIGSGKTTVARSLSAQLLGLKEMGNYPYYFELAPEDKSVGIEDVRAIRGFMKRTTTGNRAIRRVCLIDTVDEMTTEAANALLKMLEEPADDTVFVLTAKATATVPQTILSRVQQIPIHAVGEKEAHAYLDADHDDSAVKRAHMMSSGRAALMMAILSDAEHPLVISISEAKVLLTASVYERLCRVDEWAKDKQRTESLLFGLERIATSLVSQSAAASSPARLKRGHRTLAAVSRAQQALRTSANPKLLLCDLFLNM